MPVRLAVEMIIDMNDMRGIGKRVDQQREKSKTV